MSSLKKMACDNDSSWNTSKTECEFNLLSVVKEALTNISFTGETTVSVNYYTINDNDTELLEIYDDGKGFPDEATFKQALTLSSTSGEGNSNFGVGMKSPMLIPNKVGIAFHITSGLELINCFKFKTYDLPTVMDVSPEISKQLLEHYRGKTAMVVLYGEDYTDRRRRGEFQLNNGDITRDIINKTDFVHNKPSIEDDEDKSLTDELSISYADKISEGNKITFNDIDIVSENIFTTERCDGIKTDVNTYKHYLIDAEVITYKKGDIHVELSNGGEMIKKGYIKNNSNSLKFCKVGKKRKNADIVNRLKLTMMHEKKGYAGIKSERGVYIKSDGVIISVTEIPGISDNTHMRCLLEEIYASSLSYINRKRNKSHTQISEKHKKTITKLIKHMTSLTDNYKDEGVNYKSVESNQTVQTPNETIERINESTVEGNIPHSSRTVSNMEESETVETVETVETGGNETSGNETDESYESDKSQQSKHFTQSVKRQALQNQPSCRLTGISNRMYGKSQIYDHDHIMERKDGGEGELTNCQVLNVVAHRIKSIDPEKFDELTNSDESIIQFRFDLLIDIATNTAEKGLVFSPEQVVTLMSKMSGI